MTENNNTDEPIRVTVTRGDRVIFVGAPGVGQIVSITHVDGYPAHLHCDLSDLSAQLELGESRHAN